MNIPLSDVNATVIIVIIQSMDTPRADMRILVYTAVPRKKALILIRRATFKLPPRFSPLLTSAHRSRLVVSSI
jgi:hypothetical protein